MMLTLEDVTTAVEATNREITRRNYRDIADEIYPQGKTYSDIYALAQALTFRQKEELVELTLDIPEVAERKRAAKLHTRDWSCMAIGLVLTRQAWDAEYPIVHDYVMARCEQLRFSVGA